jgi:hypothetical protein
MPIFTFKTLLSEEENEEPFGVLQNNLFFKMKPSKLINHLTDMCQRQVF